MPAYNRKATVTSALDKDDIVAQLKQLGVRPGMVLEVHSAMSTLGFVIGGARTIVDALIEAVGDEGTLVMPLQSADNTEPGFWQNPPADRSLWGKIRENMPPTDPNASEFPYMGSVVNNLNRRNGRLVSNHPSCAVMAYGKYAKLITDKQPIDFSLSDQSPLGVMYQLPSYILLIGVSYDNCTGMHLAEYRSNVRPVLINGAGVGSSKHHHWQKYLDIDLDSDEFVEIGQVMEQKKMVTIGRVGASTCRLFKFSEAVDFATDYLQQKYLL